MFRRKVALDPETDARLAECAQRWGISVEEVAWWALHVGLAELQALPAPPEDILGPRDESGVESAPIVRLCNAILVLAMDDDWPLLEIEPQGETGLAVHARRGAERVPILMSDAESATANRLDGLRAEAIVRYGSLWPGALWRRFCAMAELPLRTPRGSLVGHILLRHQNQNWRVTVLVRRVGEERRMRLRMERETRPTDP